MNNFFSFTHAILFNSVSFFFPGLPFKIIKGGNLRPKATILNTKANRHFSLQYVIISIFFPFISIVSFPGFSK